MVPYLLANGVRLSRVVYDEDASNSTPPSTGPSAVSQHPAASGNLHVFFELGDHLGSTAVVLDKATGELVERSTHQAYGATESDYRPTKWNSFREDYQFTGKEEDVEVGLQYFGKRYLNPLLGRWISADPLAVHAPGEADLNVYAYVKATVLKSVDPLGLFDLPIHNETVAASVDSATSALQSTGLATRMVNSVRAPRHGVTYAKGGDAWNTVLNTMFLSEKTVGDLGYVSDRGAGEKAGTLGGWVGVQTLYHESTHAYLDLYGDQYSKEIAAGEAHYAGARLADGTTVSDRSRVFHEAIASYVGHRAAQYTATQQKLENLRDLVGQGLDVEIAREHLAKIASEYNSEMARRDFGYEEKWDGSQVEVERGISDSMKRFADEKIMDGSVADRFEAVSEFQGLIEQIDPAAGKTNEQSAAE